MLKKLIEKQFEKQQQIRLWINRDFNNKFDFKQTSGIGKVTCDSMWYPFMQKLIKAVQDKENIYGKIRDIQSNNINNIRLAKDELFFEYTDAESQK